MNNTSNSLEQINFFLKKKRKNVEEMTNHEWGEFILEFLDFCMPYILMCYEPWQVDDEPTFDLDLKQHCQNFGSLKYLICKEAAYYQNRQMPMLAPDIQTSIDTDITWKTKGKRIISTGVGWADHLEETLDENHPYYSTVMNKKLVRRNGVIFIEGYKLVVYESVATDNGVTRPWEIGWYIRESTIKFATAENLAELFEKKDVSPQKIMRFLFDFTKGRIASEQHRIANEKIKNLLEKFGGIVLEQFMA